MIPWAFGKYLSWDAAVVHTGAASYITEASISASEPAAARKRSKYDDLPSTHTFVPIALETLGPINSEGIEFLQVLGRRLSSRSGDKRESLFLFQRISVCVQRFNAVVIKSSFPAPPEDEA